MPHAAKDTTIWLRSDRCDCVQATIEDQPTASELLARSGCVHLGGPTAGSPRPGPPPLAGPPFRRYDQPSTVPRQHPSSDRRRRPVREICGTCVRYWNMSTRDQIWSSALHGEALLTARRPELQPLIDHLRDVAQGRDDIRVECAGSIAGSWFCSAARRGEDLIAAGLLMLAGPLILTSRWAFGSQRSVRQSEPEFTLFHGHFEVTDVAGYLSSPGTRGVRPAPSGTQVRRRS